MVLECQTEEWREAIIRVAIIILQLNDTIWCPMLLPLVVILMTEFSEAESYFVAYSCYSYMQIMDHVLTIESIREKYLIDREDRYNALLRGSRVPDR